MSKLPEKYLSLIDVSLSVFLPGDEDGDLPVGEMMAYSLKNGGKRIRPVLTLEFCRLCGGSPEKALPFACALEYIHTYSLIHDDLPCMDNDDFRRGQPSSHKKFGEANALLAGDALLTRAFGILAEAELPPYFIVRAVDALADAAGAFGMIGGQYLDLAGENKSLSVDDLRRIDELKTGALIKCACLLGCIAADADIDSIDAAEAYAENLGVAFQIVDDILDVTADEDYLGKPVGSDEKNGKNTYVTLLGLEGAAAQAEKYTADALNALDFFGDRASDLKQFTRSLLERAK
ncbi:MAG: polyprenyl synthetase family protein [Clostridia bacterium]|nr:polyprenyl synthetase family protein [Clostridia bacterium]